MLERVGHAGSASLEQRHAHRCPRPSHFDRQRQRCRSLRSSRRRLPHPARRYTRPPQGAVGSRSRLRARALHEGLFRDARVQAGLGSRRRRGGKRRAVTAAARRASELTSRPWPRRPTASSTGLSPYGSLSCASIRWMWSPSASRISSISGSAARRTWSPRSSA